MENENIYNIIVAGNYEDIDKDTIMHLFGNPEQSSLSFTIEDSQLNMIECYSRQIEEKIFKGIRIIFFKNFDLNDKDKDDLFQKLVEKLNRKGLICFYITENEKINIFNHIINYEIVSYDHPLFTFIEKEEEENKLIENKKSISKNI